MAKQLDILAFGAHPDDVELSCGGTIAKEVSLGKKVGIVDLTRGELGTRGTAEIRDKEAKQAASILGVSMRENLGFRDGFFKNDEANQLEIIKILRKYRPKLVLCNAQTDRHIDHGRAALLIHEASFLSGLRKIDTVVDGMPQKPWRPSQVYHYMQWNNDPCDFVVDISEYIDKKMAAILAFGSQFYMKNRMNQKPQSAVSSFWTAFRIELRI